MPDRSVSERGFSIVEVLIVLVIVASLMAIVVPSMQRSKVSRQREAMVAAAELVAAGVGRVNGDWPSVGGQGDVLADARVAAVRKAELCPSTAPVNPVCNDNDLGLFTRTGAPATARIPADPYGTAGVRVERGCVTVAASGEAPAELPGRVRYCRTGTDGFRVQAFGRSSSGRTILVYDTTFQ